MGAPMGAPLILTKNRNGSPENSSSPAVVEEQQTQTTPEIPEHEEDNAVNGKLDINIKDNNSIYAKPESNAQQFHQFNDLKHNYHWFIESCHMALYH